MRDGALSSIYNALSTVKEVPQPCCSTLLGTHRPDN
jgi:hypothetical protein